jgi:PIN domain nuclease of toxin-antitoxin system
MSGRYVLDACAVLALLHDEPGADVVADLIDSAELETARVSMHKANLLEVYYDIYRSRGKDRADKNIIEFIDGQVTIISDISDELFAEAGRLKSQYKISFADIFALATAATTDAILVTADHHEMDEIEKKEPRIKILWIR